MNRNMESSSQSPASSQQLLLEQQIKLSQLQQLQQLQQQIFQQQMALISGKPSNIGLDMVRKTTTASGPTMDSTLSGLPTPAPSGEIRPQHEYLSPMISGYMEPLPHSMIPSSPLPHQRSAQLTLQNQLQELARQQQQVSNGYPPSPASFQHNGTPAPTSPVFRPNSSSATTTAMSSPTHIPVSPMHLPTSSQPSSPATFGSGHPNNPHRGGLDAFDATMFSAPENLHRQSMPGHSNSNPTTAGSTPRSAPERVAFNIYSHTPPNAGSIPNLTIDSPLLQGLGSSGSSHTHEHSGGMPPHRSTNNVRRGSSHTSPQQNALDRSLASNAHRHQTLDAPPILDQDISPLTSPRLEASPSGPPGPPHSALRAHTSTFSVTIAPASSNPGRHKPSTSLGVNANKRTAPPSDSGDESSNPNPRKRQSPAIRPMLTRMSSTGGAQERNIAEGNQISETRGRSGSPASATNLENLPPPLTMENALRGYRLPLFNPPNSSPSHTGSTSPISNMSSGSANGRKTHRNSRSAASTPSLRGTGGPVARGPTSRSTTTRHGAGPNTSTSEGTVHDSPSPVDLGVDDEESREGARVGESERENRAAEQHRDAESGMERDRRVMPPPPVPSSSTSSSGNPNGSNMEVDTSRNIDMEQFDGMMNLDFGMSGMHGLQMQQDNRFDMSAEMSMNMGELGLTSPMNSMGMNNMNSVSMGNIQLNGMGEMGNFNMMHLPMGDFGMSAMEFGGGQHDHIQSSTAPDTPHSQSQMDSQVNGRLPPAPEQPDPQLSMSVATPASMLNLGRPGRRLRSESANATPRSSSKSITRKTSKEREKSKAVDSSSSAGASTSSKISKKSNAANLVSPALKPIRPAGDPRATLASSSAGPSSSSSAPRGAAAPSGSPQASSESVIRQPKRTHRDAEQRRRNSQKQVIDDLRRLLPPISQPTNSSNPDDIPAPTFNFQSTHAPLLPGGLPPRGPPKAGSDGPNKNVSKLQVLLCGNEYIRVLTKRVERRDDEIEKLRREVKRLRGTTEDAGEVRAGEDVAEEIDLEKDLDEIERIEPSGSVRVSGTLENLGEEAMDEDEEDGDD